MQLGKFSTTKYHFMGIGGQGISAVAQMAQQVGCVVTGCDRQASATTRALEQAGIAVQIGHSPEHLADVEALVISPAVPALDANNPELAAAQARGVPVIYWQALLGDLMADRCVLSVSGVHGKGTTTAMLALMLVEGGLDPTCEIGAVVPRFGANYRIGQSQYFVNEADEFNHNFWHYHPRLTVVTSIEFEHPEFFADYEAFLAAFEHFIGGMDMQGDWSLPATLILNADSPGCLELYARLGNWPGRALTYGVEGITATLAESLPLAFEAYDVKLAGETSFRVRAQGDELFMADRVINLQLPGVHNVQNALAALAAARTVGVGEEAIVRALESFGGIRRRFEIRHQGALAVNGRELDIMLVDDYAHHPTAIASTLEAARGRYPGWRIVAVYQPHMYSRTKTFFTQFIEAFDGADVAIIADIFPARERDTGLIHASELVAEIAKRPHFAEPGKQVLSGGGIEESAALLTSLLQSGDLVLVMGAGDIYRLTELVLQTNSNLREAR